MADTTKTPQDAPDTTQGAPAAPDTSGTPTPAPKASTKPKAAAKAPAGPTYYKVLHGAVGQWAQDTVISSDDLVANVHDKGGNLIGTTPIDVDRLLRLGAIRVTDAPEEEAPPVAPDE